MSDIWVLVCIAGAVIAALVFGDGTAFWALIVLAAVAQVNFKVGKIRQLIDSK